MGARAKVGIPYTIFSEEHERFLWENVENEWEVISTLFGVKYRLLECKRGCSLGALAVYTAEPRVWKNPLSTRTAAWCTPKAALGLKPPKS